MIGNCVRKTGNYTVKDCLKVTLVLFGLSLVQVSVYSQNRSGNFSLTGSVRDLGEKKLYLKWISKSGSRIDSTVANNGVFQFDGIVDEPQLVTLYSSGYHDFLRFYLENSDIQIRGTSLENSKVCGSVTQNDYYEYQESIESINRDGEKLEEILRNSQENERDSLSRLFRNHFDELKRKRLHKTKKFIYNHPESFVSLNELRNITSRLEYKDLIQLFNSLSEEVKSSNSGRKRYEQISALAGTAIGNIAPDFILNDLNEIPTALADFRGKYVLLEFWASWCGPCRYENPNLIRAFKKYRSKGFIILGVSLDTDKGSWEKAVTQDGLLWKQLSDLKAWDSPVTKLYGIDGIPANYLIDPHGRIINKNLRGEALNDKLASLF